MLKIDKRACSFIRYLRVIKEIFTLNKRDMLTLSFSHAVMHLNCTDLLFAQVKPETNTIQPMKETVC